jgi:phospholipid-binding lipoprotein MlaA
MPSFALWRIFAICIAAYAMSFCGGCAATNSGVDPWEKTNHVLYDVDEGLDRIALKPLSEGYVKIVPEPIRTGLGNGFDNLGYFNQIVNDFLQARWQQGFSDSGRMLLNSTAGLAGFFDIASSYGMPYHDNDFGVTLGVWGVKPGPYLVLPLFGPSCARDVPGIVGGFLTDPTTWISMPAKVSIPLNIVRATDARARAARAMRFRNSVALNPYSFTRDAYLQYREGLIRGEKPATGPNIYDEDTGPAAAPSTQTAPATQATPSTQPDK